MCGCSLFATHLQHTKVKGRPVVDLVCVCAPPISLSLPAAQSLGRQPRRKSPDPSGGCTLRAPPAQQGPRTANGLRLRTALCVLLKLSVAVLSLGGLIPPAAQNDRSPAGVRGAPAADTLLRALARAGLLTSVCDLARPPGDWAGALVGAAESDFAAGGIEGKDDRPAASRQ